jgi:hypothetical protein
MWDYTENMTLNELANQFCFRFTRPNRVYEPNYTPENHSFWRYRSTVETGLLRLSNSEGFNIFILGPIVWKAFSLNGGVKYKVKNI